MSEGDFMKIIAKIALLRSMAIIIILYDSRLCLFFFAILQCCDRQMIDENHNWWKALEAAV